MPVSDCLDCGKLVSTAAPACIHCGRPNGLGTGEIAIKGKLEEDVAFTKTTQPERGSFDKVGVIGSKAQPGTLLYPAFPVSAVKFVMMSTCTFGIYILYWSYQQWRRIEAHSGQTINPGARAFFSFIWSYTLFTELGGMCRNCGIAVPWSPFLLVLLYIGFTAANKLHTPYYLLALLASWPFVPVLRSISSLNRSFGDLATESRNHSFSALNVIGLVLGGSMQVIIVIGSFLK